MLIRGGTVLRKRFITACVLIIVTLCLAVFAYITSQGDKLNKILQVNFTDITRIDVINGRTGGRKTIEDKEKIKEFLIYIDSFVIKPIEGNPEVKPGYASATEFFAGDKKLFTLQFLLPYINSNVNLGVNGIVYKVIKTDLTTEKKGGLLK
jgi:hypothetical protein